jgi:hypothetical protein
MWEKVVMERGVMHATAWRNWGVGWGGRTISITKTELKDEISTPDITSAKQEG